MCADRAQRAGHSVVEHQVWDRGQVAPRIFRRFAARRFRSDDAGATRSAEGGLNMPGDTNPSKVRAHAARSAADALLRTLGGTRVFVRVPSPMEDSTNAAELGIATTPVSDILLAPVVLRNLSAAPPGKIELLVSANTLLRCCGIEDAS